jgi:hypothetical protein
VKIFTDTKKLRNDDIEAEFRALLDSDIEKLYV